MNKNNNIKRKKEKERKKEKRTFKQKKQVNHPRFKIAPGRRDKRV